MGQQNRFEDKSETVNSLGKRKNLKREDDVIKNKSIILPVM